jgi:hypothetical protein
LNYNACYNTNCNILSTLLFVVKLRENLFSLGAGSVDVTNHVETGLWQIVTLSVHDGLEGTDGVLQVDQDAFDTYDIN